MCSSTPRFAEKARRLRLRGGDGRQLRPATVAISSAMTGGYTCVQKKKVATLKKVSALHMAVKEKSVNGLPRSIFKG